ncbi:MAG: histidinol phosphate phosphatase domain-containing protein [Candidatus Omnitrophota bacterium]|jgi:histidinol phosphatase-like PHP family hydrolase
MYNLHCHSLLSDGVLLPSEIAVRYLSIGYKAIAITDHADYSNIDTVAEAILCFTGHWPKDSNIRIFPGVELTHIPPEQFKPLVKRARAKGLKVIIGHGETLTEPVIKGTNRAALEAGVDILAHPGLITQEDAALAAKKGIFLEITCRKGHRDTNAHVVDMGIRSSAKLIINADSHSPEDIINPQEAEKFALAAGLSETDIKKIYKDVTLFLSGKGAR